MSDTFTFWQLLSEKSIQIPVIQRDYAQGREKDNINKIRKNFLDAIYNSLTQQKHLHLDFVYGYEKNANFIPLDGQQRLTTLFLLHWYLAWKDNALNGETQKTLSGFTYKLRVSSGEFCDALVNKFAEKYEKAGNTPGDAIEKSSWFFTVWKRDPTIKSMLKMLDDIHENFCETQKLFSILINKEKCPLSFSFLDLAEFSLDDELYIRMNARGKSLTEFEIFKSSLLQHIESLECGGKLPEDYKDKFMRKMDGKWLDFFWEKIKEKNNKNEKSEQDKKEEMSEQTDQAILYFINVVFDNLYLKATKEKHENFQVGDIGRISKEGLEKISSEDIRELEIILDILAKKDNRWIYELHKPVEKMDGQSIIDKVIEAANTRKFEYSDSLKFFAFCCVITATAKKQNPDLREWMRIARNLIEGTIYNNFSEYVRDLKLIDSWKPSCLDILAFIANNKEISSNSTYQLQEEKLKAALIVNNGAWKEPIEKAEEHPYFTGQIDFLLDFAGINKKQPEVSANEERTLPSFLRFSKKAEAVFNDQGIAKEESLWRRALLCMGDYTLRSGANNSFVINGFDRDISWKRLLRDSGEKRDCVKMLLDEIDCNSIKESLENVMEKNKEKIDDWRKYFIFYPQILAEQCGKDRYIRITNDDKNNILLLLTTRVAGYCSEYFSYALFCELAEKIPDRKDIKYENSQGYNVFKGLILGSDGEKDGAPEKIYITYGSRRIKEDGTWDGKWIVGASRSLKKEDITIFDSKDELKEYLRTIGSKRPYRI